MKGRGDKGQKGKENCHCESRVLCGTWQSLLTLERRVIIIRFHNHWIIHFGDHMKMKNKKEMKGITEILMASQLLCVLATEANHRPHASLMAFAYSEDLKRIFLATDRATQKYNNLSRNNHIALLIDNRTNSINDFAKAIALTVLGYAKELHGEERGEAANLLHARFDYLKDFIKSSSCSLFEIEIEQYILVDEFHQVNSWKP